MDTSAIQNSIVNARQVNLYQGDGAESRFLLNVDERGDEITCVTEKYRLVTATEILDAMDRSCARNGVNLTATAGEYFNGRSCWVFKIEGTTYTVPGDSSPIDQTLWVINSYHCTNALEMASGAIRGHCWNGMWFGKSEAHKKKRHVGEIDVDAWVDEMLLGAVKRAEVDKVIAEVSTSVELPYTHEVYKQVGRDTPARYHRALHDSIKRYEEMYGRPTAWGLLQGISEIATHDMPGWSRHAWNQRNSERVLALMRLETWEQDPDRWFDLTVKSINRTE